MKSQSLHRSTFWAGGFFLFSFGKTILLTPLMLKEWGAIVFAFWAILLSIRAIALFISDGYLRFLGNEYNLLYHEEPIKAQKVLASGFVFCALTALLPVLLLYSWMWLQPNATSFLFNAEKVMAERYSLLPALFLFLTSAALQNIQRLFYAVNEAKGKVWYNFQLEIVVLIVELLLLSYLLSTHASFFALVLADALVVGLVALVFTVWVIARNSLFPFIARVDMRMGKVYFLRSFQFNISNFFEKLATDGLVFLLAYFRLAQVSVALFATFRTMTNTPVLAQSLLLNAYAPGLQKAYTQQDRPSLTRLFRWIRLRVGPLLLLGLLCCLPLYRPVFEWWTHKKIVYDEGLFLLMLGTVVFQLLAFSFLFVLKSLNVLKDLWQLMAVKALLILLGFAFTPSLLFYKVFTLLSVELLFSSCVLPFVVNRFLAKRHLQYTARAIYQELLPYWITVGVLAVYYFIS